jgi:hypothetical protein
MVPGSTWVTEPVSSIGSSFVTELISNGARLNASSRAENQHFWSPTKFRRRRQKNVLANASDVCRLTALL